MGPCAPPFTASAWVNLDSSCGPNMKVVAGDGFHLGIGEGDYGSTNTYRTLYPEIWIDNGGGVPPSYYTFQAGTIPLGQWAQLTLLWSQSGLFQGSVNGQIVQSQTISTGSLGTGGDPIILGVDQDLASYPLHACRAPSPSGSRTTRPSTRPIGRSTRAAARPSTTRRATATTARSQARAGRGARCRRVRPERGRAGDPPPTRAERSTRLSGALV